MQRTKQLASLSLTLCLTLSLSFSLMATAGLVVVQRKPWTSFQHMGLLSLDVDSRLRTDAESTESAATDFGNMVHITPAAVLFPQSVDDVVFLVKFSYNSASPFGIAPRGRGHSTQGQAMAPSNGVVVNMRSLNNGGPRISVSRSPTSGLLYADVGGEQLWIDVLRAALVHGLAPTSWTDYLHLTVGGTLSNAGISGQTFLYGPQISNVYEMDVVTGKGELLTCSPDQNAELFYAVLGGLGQFGIIERARIALAPAPKKVKWVRMLYDDFDAFTRDQEHLISTDGLDYVEGSLILQQNLINNWRSSFFSPSDQSKIASLVARNQIIYVLEIAEYYDYYQDYFTTQPVHLKVVEAMLEGLGHVEGFKFSKHVGFEEFLNRVEKGEKDLHRRGQWEVPHPWLNLFVPKSQITDFDSAVFKDIVLKQDKASVGPILVYPTNRNKWDERMSAVVPTEDVFYVVGFLNSAAGDNNSWEVLDNQNQQILRFCEESGRGIKQYLPHYTSKKDWANHFGSKWTAILDRKSKFDPRMIFSPGQHIFSPADGSHIFTGE